MTLENISKLIELNNAPYWRLSLLTGVEKTIAGSYSLENISDTATDAAKIAASIDFLKSYLENFKGSHGQKFAIEMRKTKTANQGGVFGWFVFSIDEPQQQQQAIAGLGSVAGLGIAEQIANVKETLLLEFERKELARQKKEHEEQVRREYADLKEKRKEVEKKSAPLQFAFERMLPTLLGLFGVQVPGETLEGVPETGAEVVEENNERTEIAERVANMLNDSSLSVDQLKHLETTICNGIDKNQ